MADFCQQCSIEIFQEDFGDMKGLCKEGEMVAVLCEDCGMTYVDHNGKCITDCDHKHYSKENKV